ncbi:hypothetical protein JOE11_001217 [Robbsia andropogonis]
MGVNPNFLRVTKGYDFPGFARFSREISVISMQMASVSYRGIGLEIR